MCGSGCFREHWAYYTSIGNALESGYGYLANSIICLFVFTRLKPLLELSRTYQLSSLADLVAFRFHSPGRDSGHHCDLVGVTPLLALQIRAVADTADLLTEESLRSRRLLRPNHIIRNSVWYVPPSWPHPPRGLVMASLRIGQTWVW